MMLTVLAAVCAVGASAQLAGSGQNGYQDVRDIFVERLDRNSIPNKVNKLAVLGDELMWQTSFEDVAQRLMHEKFTVEIETDGTLTATSRDCELTAVNRMQQLERIDTLTVLVKYQLKKEVVEDSLRSIGYEFKKTSADGRYDWWKHKVSNINLAVYYNYSSKYPAAMLFARPKPAVEEEDTDDIPEAVW